MDSQTPSLGLHVLEQKLIDSGLKEPFTFGACDSVSLRLYADNQPMNLEIAQLQKGLVLMVNGVEVVEEGAGFGVPIVKYSNRTFFSTTAEVHASDVSSNCVVLQKCYSLDAVSRKQIHGVNVSDDFYRTFRKAFERLYLSNPNLLPVFDWVMQVRQPLGFQTRFVKVPSKGKVTVTYQCFPSQIKVHVDLSALDKAMCREVLLLNEQGAAHFRRYRDSEGNCLWERQIGAWTKVTANKGAFYDAKTGLFFSLENIEGATLYRGREQVKARFSWSGMTYSINPRSNNFDYTIRMTRAKSTQFLLGN